MGFLEVVFYAGVIVVGAYLLYDLIGLIAGSHMDGPDGPSGWA